MSFLKEKLGNRQWRKGIKHRYLREVYLALRHLRFKMPRKGRRMGVVKVDGRVYHGGMNDRFKGIITWWHYCRTHDMEFRIFYNYPFELTEYVVPNEYDWRIEEKDIPDSIFDTRYFYGRGERGARLLRFHTRRNVIYYGNIDIGAHFDCAPYNESWGKAFRTLFKPSPLVNTHLEKLRGEIGGDYVAAVYRFQNLLGDFPEYKFKELHDEAYADVLVKRSLEELDKIHGENPGYKVLGTSDSARFLGAAAEKDYVFVIPGKVEHMGSSGNDRHHVQLKSFLDYFMIAGASKVYSVIIGPMYRSEFPEYAAKINDVPFERRKFED